MDNSIILAYALAVGGDRSSKDSDGKIWQTLVDYVKPYEIDFFTKSGDFRKKQIVDIKRIMPMNK